MTGEWTPLISGICGALGGGVYLAGLYLLPKWKKRRGVAHSVAATPANHSWHVPLSVGSTAPPPLTKPILRIRSDWRRWKSWFPSKAFIWPAGAVLAAFLLATSLLLFALPKAGMSCLEGHMPQMSWSIEEKDAQHLYDELKVLYPRLEECGLDAPLLDPRQTGNAEYDNTWLWFHRTSLKALYRQLRNGSFNLEVWNEDFDRENAKRNKAAERPREKK